MQGDGLKSILCQVAQWSERSAGHQNLPSFSTIGDMNEAELSPLLLVDLRRSQTNIGALGRCWCSKPATGRSKPGGGGFGLRAPTATMPRRPATPAELFDLVPFVSLPHPPLPPLLALPCPQGRFEGRGQCALRPKCIAARLPPPASRLPRDAAADTPTPPPSPAAPVQVAPRRRCRCRCSGFSGAGAALRGEDAHGGGGGGEGDGSRQMGSWGSNCGSSE